MEAKNQFYQTWSAALRRWGLRDLVAFALEAGGPVNFLFAQAVYLGQPLLGLALPRGHLQALAALLEDGTETQAFLGFLREGNRCELSKPD